MAKKTNILLFIILLIVLSLIYIGSVLRNYYSFANDIVLNPSITTQNNDTITVIFIGDSWAAYHSKYDHHLMTCIETKVKKPTKVISKGTVGAKTKTIYKEMHIDGPSGTKELIELSGRFRASVLEVNGYQPEKCRFNVHNVHFFFLFLNEWTSKQGFFMPHWGFE